METFSGWSFGPLLGRNWPTTKEGNNPTSFAYFSQQKVDVLSLNATTKTIRCFLNIPAVFSIRFFFVVDVVVVFLVSVSTSIKHVKCNKSGGSVFHSASLSSTFLPSTKKYIQLRINMFPVVEFQWIPSIHPE